MSSTAIGSPERLLQCVLLFSVLLFAAAAQADHTADPAGVALVGSLQSELGCPGDWQPECSATELTNVPGTTLWQVTFAVPAGFWEWKIALNDSWDENYGDGGQGGGNFQLELLAPRLARHGVVHAPDLAGFGLTPPTGRREESWTVPST